MVVIGTLFKQQRLRANVLDDYTKEGAMKQVGAIIQQVTCSRGWR